MPTKYSKVYGSLLAAAIGDAMGCPLETRPVYLVKEDFGNGDFVFDYKETLPDSIAAGMERARVTDDFSVAYISAKHYLKNGGVIDRKSTIDALIEWKNSPDTAIFFEKYGGPTTRKAIALLEGDPNRNTSRDFFFSETKTATNGGGMKAWIAGLFNPGNIEKAIDDAITMCFPTHDNPIALSAACAVSAAVAQALVKDARLDQVIEAGIGGARVGFSRVQPYARPTSGASVEERIKLAIEIGIKYAHDFEKCVMEMTDHIGTGLNANESTPSAFGYLVAGGGDVMKTIYLAINSGNDCDTTAIMAGSIAGALFGCDNIDSYHHETLSKANSFIDFSGMAMEICECTT